MKFYNNLRVPPSYSYGSHSLFAVLNGGIYLRLYGGGYLYLYPQRQKQADRSQLFDVRLVPPVLHNARLGVAPGV